MDPHSEDVPDWYPLMRAARWMGVPPWVLRDKPIWWRDRALLAEQAEAAHEAHLRKKQQKALGKAN